MVLLLADAGLGSTEMAELKLSDVNLREGYLVAGRGKRRRVVPLTPRLTGALADYIAVVGQRDGLLLPGRKGVMSARAVHDIVSKLAARGGVKVAPRDLTESFYFRLAQKGVGLETLAALKGVSKLDSVKRFFDTPCELQKLRDSVRLLEGN
jgi:site-specific recombinase XerD